jgi:hypothetical protein
MALLLAATATLAGVAACGAPAYTYVADNSAHAYFKVPSGWHSVPASALASELKVNGSGAWLSGFGADAPTASAGSVYSFDVGKPFVLAEVGELNAQASDALSYNELTDIFLPVTSTARSEAAGQLPVTNFQLLRQSTLTLAQGVHGVRVVYDYTWTDGVSDGSADTFDQVALTNADQTELYLLIVHCTTACYSHYQNAINGIMSSFTVRSPL